MYTQSERIAYAIIHSGKKQNELAKVLGVSTAAISMMVTGQTQTIRSDKLFPLARATGFSAQWIAEGKGEKKASPYEADHIVVTEHDGNDYLIFRRQWIQYIGINEQDLTFIYASDDAMYPAITKDDAVIIHSLAKTPKDRGVYAIKAHNNTILRRFFSNLTGTWTIKGDNQNSSSFLEQVISSEEISKLNIIGEAIWHSGMIK